MSRIETHESSTQSVVHHLSAETRPPLLEAQRTPVRRIMSREVMTTRVDVSLDSVVERMLEEGLSRVPVVDEAGILVGILSKTDLIEQQHGQGDTQEERALIPWRRGINFPEKGMHIHGEEAIVEDVMKRSPVTTTEVTSIARAAELMCRYELHGLPVVSSDGRVLGMVTPLDIARWVAGLA